MWLAEEMSREDLVGVGSGGDWRKRSKCRNGFLHEKHLCFQRLTQKEAVTFLTKCKRDVCVCVSRPVVRGQAGALAREIITFKFWKGGSLQSLLPLVRIRVAR